MCVCPRAGGYRVRGNVLHDGYVSLSCYFTLVAGDDEWKSGYYIHTCPKMKYKAEYSPSFLLDPETYDFYPFDEVCKPMLDKNSHAVFSNQTPCNNEEATQEANKADDLDAKSEEEGDSEEEEDGTQTLSSPPPPGFLDPTNLPFELLSEIYSFDKGSAIPLLVRALPLMPRRLSLSPNACTQLSKPWRSNANAQRRIREGIAAMGSAAKETCIFV